VQESGIPHAPRKIVKADRLPVMLSEGKSLELNIYLREDTCAAIDLAMRGSTLGPKESSRQLREAYAVTDTAVRYLQFMANYKDGLFRPDRCDVYEPIREVFDPQDLKAPARWLSQVSGRVMLKKLKPFRYEGFVENMRHPDIWVGNSKIPMPSVPDPVFVTEWCFWLDRRILKKMALETVRQFFIDLFLETHGDYGFLTPEEDHKTKNYVSQPTRTGTSYFFEGDKLEEGLPGIYWGNIFGKIYVDWFGRDKMLTVPCHYREELPDGSFYIQAEEDIFYLQYPFGMEADARIIKHLGAEAFYDINDRGKKCLLPPIIIASRGQQT